MKKLYIGSEKELNEEEIKTGRISYLKLVDRVCKNRVLCNNISEIDNTIWDNVLCGTIGDDTDIFQYYLVDMSEWDLEYAKEFEGELILSYSNVLDLYVLMVDHFGTSWDYVMTGIEWTTDFDEVK